MVGAHIADGGTRNNGLTAAQNKSDLDEERIGEKAGNRSFGLVKGLRRRLGIVTGISNCQSVFARLWNDPNVTPCFVIVLPGLVD